MIRRKLSLLLVAGAVLAPLAYAQTREDEQRAIALARKQAEEATSRSKLLDQLSDKATDEAARAQAESAALAARVEASEADITAAEAQLRIVRRLQAEQRARLAERQEPVARLVAALQTMSRRPPALALVQPGSVENMVHVRALLASTLPVVRARTAALRHEIEAADRLGAQAERAVAALRTSREELRDRRLALARFEEEQRLRSQRLAESALFQSDRALALGEEARELSSRLQSRQYQAQLRSELAELPGPVLRPTREGSRAPAPAFRYRMPIEADLIAGTGEISNSGVHSRGIVFTTRGNEPVIAPAAGQIVYGGPFRSYGQVVMIDHGRGWMSVITDLQRLDAAVGTRVDAGRPLGRARRGSLTVELRRNGRPMPITPLLNPS